MDSLVDSVPASAARQGGIELDELREQTREARAALARVRENVGEAAQQLGNLDAIRLLEANERLLALTMLAQRAVGECEDRLLEASRATDLDDLTGLPSRVLLRDRFARAIALAKRNRKRAALLFLDLDNFKEINDTLGHAGGDRALKLTAERLVGAVRKADTVSRHGGDEFVILLAEVSRADDAVRVADKLVAALSAPHGLGREVGPLAGSVGISIYPDHGEDADTLIERADAAMYQAKKDPFGSVVLHHQASPAA